MALDRSALSELAEVLKSVEAMGRSLPVTRAVPKASPNEVARPVLSG